MASIHRRVTPAGETRWDVRYRDPNRVDRSKSFRLKSEAARFAAAVEADIDRMSDQATAVYHDDLVGELLSSAR